MKPPVPKIRTQEQLSLLIAVPDSYGTAGPDPIGRPVLSSPSPEGGQVCQGAERLTEIRERAAERRRVREELAEARAYGVAARHRTKIARNRRKDTDHS